MTAAQKGRCMPLMLLLLLMLMVTTRTPPMALPALMIASRQSASRRLSSKRSTSRRCPGAADGAALPSSSGDELLPRPHAGCNQHLPSYPLTRTRTHAQSSYPNHKPRRFVVVVVITPSPPRRFGRRSSEALPPQRRKTLRPWRSKEHLVPSRPLRSEAGSIDVSRLGQQTLAAPLRRHAHGRGGYVLPSRLHLARRLST